MKIGIDIGGSHIGIGLVDGDKLLDSVEAIFTYEEKKNIKETILKNIDELISKLLYKNDLQIQNIEMIGIASPRNNFWRHYC